MGRKDGMFLRSWRRGVMTRAEVVYFLLQGSKRRSNTELCNLTTGQTQSWAKKEDKSVASTILTDTVVTPPEPTLMSHSYNNKTLTSKLEDAESKFG